MYCRRSSGRLGAGQRIRRRGRRRSRGWRRGRRKAASALGAAALRRRRRGGSGAAAARAGAGPPSPRRDRAGVKGTPGISGTLIGAAGSQPGVRGEVVGVGDDLGPRAVAVVLLGDRGQGFAPAHRVVDDLHLGRLVAQGLLGLSRWWDRGRGRRGIGGALRRTAPRASAARPSSRRWATPRWIWRLEALPGLLSLPVIGVDGEGDLALVERALEVAGLARAARRPRCAAPASRCARRGQSGRGGGGGASTRGGGRAAGAGGGRRRGARARRTAASAATARARADARRSSLQRLVVDDVEVARELLDAHLTVDLAPMDLPPGDEGRVRLAPHGEGGAVAVLPRAA